MTYSPSRDLAAAASALFFSELESPPSVAISGWLMLPSAVAVASITRASLPASRCALASRWARVDGLPSVRAATATHIIRRAITG
jgi:hypothetical protein